MSRIEKRIAAWTFLPEGNSSGLPQIVSLFGSIDCSSSKVFQVNVTAIFFHQKMLRTFRYSDTRTDKNMILILIIFKTKSINCRAVTVMQRC